MQARYYTQETRKKSRKIIKEEYLEGVLEEMTKEIKNPAKVFTDRKATINVGNFNSASFTVGIEVPCEASAEGIEEGYKKASDFCEEKLAELVKTVRGE